MKERGVKKRLQGEVISHKTDKTAVVSVRRVKKHKVFQKFTTVQKKYMVHDPQNRCHVGDKVRIIESKPISRMKRWLIEAVLERAAERGEDIGGAELDEGLK